MARDIAALVSAMTLDEKAALTAGANNWQTVAVERLAIPAVTVTDGPAGARGPSSPGVGGQIATLQVPCGAALGATWNVGLLAEVGDALGDQARTKACRVLLAPTVNIHRSPLSGRNFECYSEDPLLAGRLAAAFVRGVQSQGVAVTVKHFAGNEAEFERMSINSVIDDRTLREVYLLPFELAVREGGALGIMTAYNRLNGSYCSEHVELLGILRDDWGFEGFVVTDWYAGGSTVGAAAAGLDLQMPGPARFYGKRLAAAVRDGGVDEAAVDAVVTRLLSVFDRLGALDDDPAQQPIAVDRPEHRALARRAAVESMVLLKNDGVLPFDPTTIRTLAVVGPNAEWARTGGGGSAEVLPHHRTPPLAAIAARLGDGVTILHERGCTIDRTAPVIPGELLESPAGARGFTVEVFAGTTFGVDEHGAQGDPAFVTSSPDGRVLVVPLDPTTFPKGPLSIRASARFTPAATGPHQLALVQTGPSRVLLDGKQVLDGVTDPPRRGRDFYGLGSEELRATVSLTAGVGHDLVVEYVSSDRAWVHGTQLGLLPVPPTDLLDRAVAAAERADAVVVVVGTNDNWESEGYDREDLDLPGAQATLIERITAANPRTAVVLNAGAPVSTGWAASTPAVVQAWFGGQEMAGALCDVLFGDADPGGRLPTTFPVRIEDNPSFGNYPGEHGQVRYGEGLLVGYRWYDARRIAPAFAFGHGLSYTTFEWGPARPSSTTSEAGEHISVEVDVTNVGSRAGWEVVQCYVAPISPRTMRPPKELKAFAKAHVEPGATATVRLELDGRAFACWDPGNAYRAAERATPGGAMVHVEGDGAPGWRIDPGVYELHLARSAADVVEVVQLTLREGDASESA